MTKNLPALRYELFIKRMEREAISARERFTALERMEHPYNVVKAAMEAARLPNEQSIRVSAGSLSIKITAIPTDLVRKLDDVIAGVGKALHLAGFRSRPDCARLDGGSGCHLWGSWNCSSERSGSFSVYISIDLPRAGLPDCEVIESERKFTTIEYELRRREPPTYAAPLSFKTAGDERAAFAASEEVVF